MESKWFHHISFTKYRPIIPFFSKMVALHQNVSNCQNTLTLLTYGWMYEWVRCVWQMRAWHNTISSVGLPIPLDRLDKMKFLPERTIPIILPSRKNILVNMVFKITVGYTNLDTRQIQSRLGSRVCLFIAPNTIMAGYPTKNNVFISKI